MANVSTTLVIKSKNETQQGINEAKSSFQQFTSSIDSITGGLGSKITNLLANPWTAVAAGVGVAAKSLKELTAAGMEGQDRLLKFSAMLGSKGEASSLIGTISKLSDTSFESRDAIEAFAEKLVGAGRSAEEVEKILSATIDISNTSGRSFKEVGSAIENAFAGKTTQIEKMVPGLKDLGKEAWASGDAIKYIGDELHDASVQIASGSLSNQLGAIGNSWQQIKENLGTSIVTQIQATGILDTIANWLEKIEDHTRKQQEASFYEGDWGYIKNQAKAGQFGNINEALLSGTLSAEAAKAWVNQFEGQIVPFQWQRDAITAIDRALEELEKVTSTVDKTVDELDLDFFSIIKQWRAVDDPKNMSDAVKEGFLSSLDAIESGYITAGADQSRLENLAKLRSNIDTGAPNVSEWQLFTTATATGVSRRASTGMYEATKSPYSLMLEGDWEMLDQSDFGKAFNAALLSGSEDAWDEVQVYYDAWLMWKNPTPTSTTTLMTYAEHMAKRQANDAIRNRITAQLAAQAPEEVYRRDYSILGLAMQDMGLGYAPVGYDTVAPSYEPFGVSSLWLNGLNAPEFKLGVGEDLNYWNAGVGRRTTGGGGVNTMEGWFLDANGVWQNVEEYEKEQARIAKEEQEAADKRFNDITSNIKTVIGTLQNLTNIWKDGYQTGDISSSISAIGGAIGGKWGTILSLVGMGGSLISSWLGGGEEVDLSGTTDADYQTSLATYNGGLNLTINNNFEGANIVGAGGMEELAMTVQKQIEHWAYDNR